MNSKQQSLTGVLCLAMVFLLQSGCSLPGKADSRVKQSYLLQARGIGSAIGLAEQRPCLSLRVNTPSSSPGFDTAYMAYMTEPPRLDYFAYHQWVDTPARMLATAMELALDASKVVGTVVTGSADIRTNFRMDAELLKLQQDFEGSSSSVQLQIKVKLIDVRSRALTDSRIFTYTEAADGANPEAGVAATSRAVEQFLSDLLAFTARSLAPVSCAAIGPLPG